ncbi:hypothetical protein RF11_02866 [Thelohanellus kitauei]|uniref:Uncharacterized protein n=1 Tax=Thelohanellus kitauei TaxID=669202 RepID=A0A0C2MYU4_THEKT|nr:hypothetical protein RF11_02866 [Thelohanellus kitauei]
MIKTLGSSSVRFRIDSGEFNLTVIVTTFEEQPNLVLNLFESLGISILVKCVDKLHGEPKSNISELLSTFSDVLQTKIKGIDGYKASIRSRPDAAPIIFQARNFQYPFREKLELEITRLTREGKL